MQEKEDVEKGREDMRRGGKERGGKGGCMHTRAAKRALGEGRKECTKQQYSISSTTLLSTFSFVLVDCVFSLSIPADLR